ncbi:ImmA/IrrE family metallo-endopeptidase [Paenibacillus tuaregi]|uniref:ImmA/IrrE family metallo-endopeptidase n=1 Tax=Paenibacillus tuaregi TaxID=1816681 RepID=UPI0008397F3A|nr:ImmA/IrrE family metallo-endopeptidase [Paenibacillus tuaregi]
MDLSLYCETELEDWISSRYIEHGIHHPADLNIEEICAAFAVDLVEYEGPPFSCNQNDVIFLPKRMDARVRRVVFFHELCHVLRHAGNQKHMPELFLQHQEMEAERFLQYAAAPFFMIKELPLSESQKESVDIIASEFSLPYELAYNRLLQIQNRILNQVTTKESTRYMQQLNEADSIGEYAPGGPPPAAPSKETRRILNQLYAQLDKGVSKSWPK